MTAGNSDKDAVFCSSDRYPEG